MKHPEYLAAGLILAGFIIYFAAFFISMVDCWSRGGTFVETAFNYGCVERIRPTGDESWKR
jgi:hypothetical protein